MKVLIFVLLSTICIAQEDSFEFFPHHIGDKWSYIELPDYTYDYREITQIDTVNNDSLRFIYYNNNTIPEFKIIVDSLKVIRIISIPELDIARERVLYDFSKNVTSYWKYSKNTSIYYLSKTNENKFDMEKAVNIYILIGGVFEPGGDEEDYHWISKSKLYEGLGLVDHEWEGGEMILLGCEIDGVKYGNIVSVDNKDVSELPLNFTLKQNYPNPFNPTTTVEYTVKERSYIELNVYDILGNDIAELFKGEKQRGRYKIKFDGSDLPSGTYFIRMKSGGFRKTIKALLVK